MKDIIEIENYKLNPTSFSSLPYYKTNFLKLPENMLIVKDDEFNNGLLLNYYDNPYFKLLHDLHNIREVNLPKQFSFKNISIEEYANHINSCYADLQVTTQELRSYKDKTVFNENLWICIYDELNNKIVATGIGEIDKEVGEGILDWIQVSSEYRHQGIGKIIVNELLNRLKFMAEFVTVSGSCNNASNPKSLYLSCGFKNETIWHIMSKK